MLSFLPFAFYFYDLDSIRCQEKAIALEIEAANIRQAALHLKQAAEACEGNAQFDRAIEHYERAIEFYQLEDTKRFIHFSRFSIFFAAQLCPSMPESTCYYLFTPQGRLR